MSIHRMAALGASIMVLTAGALTGGTAGAAGQAAPSERAAGMVGVSIDRAGVITMPTALPPGVTTFKITTTRRQAGLQLVAFAPGYTVEQATLDVENGLDKNRIKALKRFEANTTLLGGASASRDKAGKLAVDLEPGTYYAVDSNKTGSPWLQLSVGGVDTGASMKVDATLTAVDSTKWAKRPAAIPRNGWLRFRNRAEPSSSSRRPRRPGRGDGNVRPFGVPQRTVRPRYMPMNAWGMPPMEASGQKQVRT